MATKFVITNTLSATEPVIDNAGAHTGPYAGAYKFNTIGIPVPLTNIQISLKPGENVTVEANDLREVAFFEAMNIPGITVKEVAAEGDSENGEDEGGESSDNTGNTTDDPANTEEPIGQ